MFAFAAHGGAGDLARYQGTGRLEEAQEFFSSLIADVHTRLDRGDTALDVITHAVVLMEDSGLFHAGRGSSPTTAGAPELDASIMEGSTRNAGAIACVRSVKNPILAARHVMEHTPQVLLVGEEADLLARNAGLEIVAPDYFVPCDIAAIRTDPRSGTVGAVALDVHGTLAAATSTGGTLRKRAGRVGDAPIIGAGTWADTECAVSCTGIGEYFLRTVSAHTVSVHVRYGMRALQDAADLALEEVVSLGGSGGLVAVHRDGSVAMPYNTSGMYRASIDGTGAVRIGVLAAETQR
jgi:L-asparaginase / beta-aspartyl-peptidase